jgi:hypothetical protein
VASEPMTEELLRDLAEAGARAVPNGPSAAVLELLSEVERLRAWKAELVAVLEPFRNGGKNGPALTRGEWQRLMIDIRAVLALTPEKKP